MKCKYCGKFISDDQSICSYCRFIDKPFLNSSEKDAEKWYKNRLMILISIISLTALIVCVSASVLLFRRPAQPETETAIAEQVTETSCESTTTVTAAPRTVTAAAIPTTVTTTEQTTESTTAETVEIPLEPTTENTNAVTTKFPVPEYLSDFPMQFSDLQVKYPAFAKELEIRSSAELHSKQDFRWNLIAFMKMFYGLTDRTPMRYSADLGANESVPDISLTPGMEHDVVFSQTWTGLDGEEQTVSVRFPAKTYLALTKRSRKLGDSETKSETWLDYCNDSDSHIVIADIAAQIREICAAYGGDDLALLTEAVHFVESLPYMFDKDGTGSSEYPKYPIETLTDGCGDCEDTAFLLAALLRELDFHVALLFYKDHIAVGLLDFDLPDAPKIEHEGISMHYLESTAYYHKIGAVSKEERYSILFAIPLAPYEEPAQS